MFPAIATDVDGDKVAIQIRHPAIMTRIEAEGIGLGDEIDLKLVEADPDSRSVKFQLV